MAKTIYLTTPIYYVNSVPHVGHALTMLVCDVAKRYHAMRGEPVRFLTGTDENGLKVLEAAREAGEEPQAFVDRIAGSFRACWDAMNFAYDDFIRTTEPRHVRAVQHLFEILRDKGAIYLDRYEGWYDVSSESFVRESDVVDGKSPDGNPVTWVSEENWFFRLSAFGDRLLEHIRAHPDFLLPESRRNEVIKFIEQGLRDMCISRANPGWGVPVPGDPSRVVYVWFDALINYLAATGWPDPGWEELWPADAHWMAKEIFTRFHATLWPAMLMAADLPLPRHVIAHGWFVFGDQKMSKSKGNVLAPLELRDEFVAHGVDPALAVDVVRYTELRCLPYEGDAAYTREEIGKHYNADLANDLGNALNRTLAMVQRFGDGVIPSPEAEAEMRGRAVEARVAFERAMAQYRPDRALEAASDLVRFLNKYIDSRAPWALAKSADPALRPVLRSMLLGLRAAEGLFRPVVPATADAMASQMGLRPLQEWALVGEEESLPAGGKIGEAKPLFPRLETKTRPSEPRGAAPAPEPDYVTIEEFSRIRLRVARVLEAEPVEGSDKLLKITLVVGEERRQVVAGIRKSYAPEDLIGRQVILVANLKPAKLRGVESQGMLLAADGPDGGAILLQPDRDAPEGAAVH